MKINNNSAAAQSTPTHNGTQALNQSTLTCKQRHPEGAELLQHIPPPTQHPPHGQAHSHTAPVVKRCSVIQVGVRDVMEKRLGEGQAVEGVGQSTHVHT